MREPKPRSESGSSADRLRLSISRPLLSLIADAPPPPGTPPWPRRGYRPAAARRGACAEGPVASHGVLSGAPLPRYGPAGRCRGSHPRSPSTLPADAPARQWVRCFLVCREVEARSLALPCRYGFPISGGCRVREYCDGVLLMPCSPSRFCWVWNVAPGGLSTGACAVAIPAPASIAANAEPIRSVRLRLPLIILFDMAISFLS